MRKLEEILNLPETKLLAKEEEKKKRPVKKTALRSVSEFDKIAAALPQVTGLGDISDTEFDDLARRATEAYDDLMDLGMNVEARFSSRIFEVASSMLKNAIDAKSSKIDKKLKMIELQLKKQKMDYDRKPTEEESGIAIPGNGFIVTDRNSLLEKLKNMK